MTSGLKRIGTTLAAVSCGALLCLPAYVGAEEGDGAAGSVESGMSKAGSATKDGLDTAGKATGEALDKALKATGEGVGYAIDETGKGFKKAGEAMSGSAEAASD